ncbi:hypothetical protein MAF45_00065 [Mesosutterella sp. OilRF-GAM-744-9]|uniref:histidine kinase n=1 Tax=Mesosutterella porci TaxID=2915351 RepID=A0ABS9MMU1_9BURK|nr:hypothetical protein [Mesosutterella sp. oilRF-744-WT-GAM-9]
MGLIASMLAHELRQPLVVITNYAQGLRIRLSRSPVDRGILLSSLDEIEAAGERADEIVEHVRNFVKGRRSSPVELDLGQEVEKMIQTFKRHCSSGIAVSFEASPRLSVRDDPVELGIIYMNLLRNFKEACRKMTVARPAGSRCGSDDTASGPCCASRTTARGSPTRLWSVCKSSAALLPSKVLGWGSASPGSSPKAAGVRWESSATNPGARRETVPLPLSAAYPQGRKN